MSLVKEYQVFYEVSPYYLLIQERHGGSPPATQKIQAGFDVDIYGVSTKPELVFPGRDPAYALGYLALKTIAKELSQHADGSCSLEVFSFPFTIVIDSRNHDAVEGMFRIRILHHRGLDQPAGEPEQHALEEVENQLRGLGVARR